MASDVSSDHERTPGGVAVMDNGGTGGFRDPPYTLCANESRTNAPDRSQAGYLETASPSGTFSQLDGETLDAINQKNRIVGWHALKQLLQPTHPYFRDKKAFIKDFQAYRLPETEACLLYPRVSGAEGERLPRLNPYRKHQLARAHTARKVKALFNIIETLRLKDFRLSCLVLTFPQELSTWLASQKNGKDMAWLCFQKLWRCYNLDFGDGHASNVNLHVWKTQEPVKPHFHFHVLIPNYRLVESDIIDENGDNALQLVKVPWHRQRGGTLVPYSDKDLDLLKQVWYQILYAFASKHRISFTNLLLEDKQPYPIDVYVDYIQLDGSYGKAKLMHKFNYQGRHPIEDYAEYSNDEPGCPYPPYWLVNYENRTRVFGWWKRLGSLVDIRDDDRERLHPATGQIMEHIGTKTWYSLRCTGQLGFLDMVRGKPVFSTLNRQEVSWLKSVQLRLPWDEDVHDTS